MTVTYKGVSGTSLSYILLLIGMLETIIIVNLDQKLHDAAGFDQGPHCLPLFHLWGPAWKASTN